MSLALNAFVHLPSAGANIRTSGDGHQRVSLPSPSSLVAYFSPNHIPSQWDSLLLVQAISKLPHLKALVLISFMTARMEKDTQLLPEACFLEKYSSEMQRLWSPLHGAKLTKEQFNSPLQKVKLLQAKKKKKSAKRVPNTECREERMS